VRDRFPPHGPAHRVLELHQLNEEVVLRIELRRGHRTFEIEVRPLLHARPPRALREVEQQRQVEHDRRGQNRVAAEEVDLHLHRIAEPAEEIDETMELILESVPRVHWYSLYDLPKAWPATTRHREAEGSSYYRHFYMGVLKGDGTPKLAASQIAEYAPQLGICQWFHFEDHRLDDAVQWLKKLGVKKLRTGLSWADHHRPNAMEWFDRQMKALEPFDVTLTYCFTPGSRGVRDHYTSPPQVVGEFAEFCAEMTRRYT
jgi:beta-xylosidase